MRLSAESYPKSGISPEAGRRDSLILRRLGLVLLPNPPSPDRPDMPNRSVFRRIADFLEDRFSLLEDKAPDDQIIAGIWRDTEFRGTNLWTLIFAILVASIGLNVNSTAVIIGAMLISPLMGPIMGIGVGVGIADFELIKKAFRNLTIAVVISVITSTTYFLITPLDEAQSELLARTSPTAFDVLIALFGGLAGIVASTRRDKGNPIPGVAIATALMPPLCTAGYGLATANWYYFLGAFYLFFINSIFISFASFIMVRVLHLPQHHFVDKARERRMKRFVWLTVVLTLLPSVYLAYRIVQQSVYRKRAGDFITREFNLPEAQIISRSIDPDTRTIELLLLGAPLSDQQIQQRTERLPRYGLPMTRLRVRQNLTTAGNFDPSTLKSSIIEDLYKRNEQLLQQRDQQIQQLRRQVQAFERSPGRDPRLVQEVVAEHPYVREFSVAETFRYRPGQAQPDTITLAVVRFTRPPSVDERRRLQRWLSARLNRPQVELLVP
jgi:uncharacterized hydrophobic protein (TIGR00271 family)